MHVKQTYDEHLLNEIRESDKVSSVVANFGKWPPQAKWAYQSLLNPNKNNNERYRLFCFLLLNIQDPEYAAYLVTWWDDTEVVEASSASIAKHRYQMKLLVQSATAPRESKEAWQVYRLKLFDLNSWAFTPEYKTYEDYLVALQASSRPTSGRAWARDEYVSLYPLRLTRSTNGGGETTTTTTQPKKLRYGPNVAYNIKRDAARAEWDEWMAVKATEKAEAWYKQREDYIMEDYLPALEGLYEGVQKRRKAWEAKGMDWSQFVDNTHHGLMRFNNVHTALFDDVVVIDSDEDDADDMVDLTNVSNEVIDLVDDN